MTELSPRLLYDLPDEEDLLLRGALSDLQQTVDDFLARTGKSINDFTVFEQQRLVDSIDPHLEFELDVSQEIYVGLPIVVSGAGGFLLTDSEGVLLGAQQTLHGDVITGMICGVKAFPVPARKIMLETLDPNEAIATYDQSLSAIIILGNAKFHTEPSEDGVFQIVHDLEEMRVIVPVVYAMETRVAGMDV